MGLLQQGRFLCRNNGKGKDSSEVVSDGSVDITGKPCIRNRSGGWWASAFIIGGEMGERMAHFGISSNLMVYLTGVMHLSIEEAAKDVANWGGVTACMPLLGGFLADAYLGRYWMVFISTIVYIIGLALLTVSVSIKSLNPQECGKKENVCVWSNNNNGHANENQRHAQQAVFFLALYLVAAGTGGHKPCLLSFGADQFNDEDPHEKKKKVSFFNWWYCGLSAGLLFGVTVIVYVEDNVSWGTGFAIVTAIVAVAFCIFLFGTPFYRNLVPKGSPFSSLAKVFTAALLNRNKNLPAHSVILYEKSWVDASQDYSSQRFLNHTESLKFLDQAAMVEKGSERKIQETNSWKLCTVTQVEEAKLVVRLLPIWLCTLVYGTAVTQPTTFFVKQGQTMNRHIGPHFQVPPASLLAASALTMTILSPLYDRLFVPIARKFTGIERGISLLQRIGTGLILMTLTLVLAAVIETKRIHAAKTYGLLDKPKSETPMSIFWLLPQYILFGIADVFGLVGLQEYFYDQVPDSMRSLGVALYVSVLGGGSFISGLLITIISKSCRLTGKENWFASNLNRSHLDYYYWLLALLNVLNFCMFVYIAKKYTYKQKKPTQVAEMPLKEEPYSNQV